LVVRHIVTTAFDGLTIEKTGMPGGVEDLPPAGLDDAQKVPDHTLSEESRKGPSLPWLTGKPGKSGPRPGRAPRDETPKLKPAAPRMPAGGLAQPLNDIYVMIGALLAPIDPTCGGAIIRQAPECAKALEALAKQNPEVRRVLVALVSTSAYGAVITAHIPIVLAVATHHLPAMRPAEDRSSNQDVPADIVMDDGPAPRSNV
jgi:hypothetical protein